jgi:hypothetical protein
MSTMIERVSRAIAEADSAAATYDELARAAIEAMTEPTEAMINARFRVLGQGGQAEWQAMIRAALKESE